MLLHLGKSGCIRAKVVVFGQKCLSSCKCCIWAKWFYSGKSACIREKGVVLEQCGCFREKVVVFGQGSLIRAKWFNSGKSCCIQANVDVFGKAVVLGQ